MGGISFFEYFAVDSHNMHGFGGRSEIGGVRQEEAGSSETAFSNNITSPCSSV